MSKLTKRRPAKAYRLFIVLTGTLLSVLAHAQADTLSLTLQQAEQQFLQKNFTLLAGHYNVDVNHALIEQAKLWDNPVLTTDQNIYAHHQFFSHGKAADGQPNGQIFIQLQQLIRTAGKRSKQVDLATTNAQLSELQLQEVLRNLKYQLRSNYYSITQLMGIRQVLLQQMNEMQHLLEGMAAQLKAGNIAQKDYLRVQALVIGLQQDIADNSRTINDLEAQLKTLLQFTGSTFIKPVDSLEYSVAVTPVLDSAINAAKAFNAAYLIEQKQLVYQQQNLVLQKALRAPDVTLGPEYDHASNYTPHYFGLTVALPINAFNKNQGNIKAATFSIKQQQATVSQSETELTNRVTSAYNKLLLTEQLNTSVQRDFYSGYKTLFNNVLQSYRQRQISLLEFIDFFEAYKDANSKLLQQQLNLQLAKEELNFETGTDFIK